MAVCNKELQEQGEKLVSANNDCDDVNLLTSSAAAITVSDFNRLVVDEVPDMSDVFLPLVSFHGTNKIDEKTGITVINIH